MMKEMRYACLLALSLLIGNLVIGQDTTAAYQWKVSSHKLNDKQYELDFTTPATSKWELYAPGQVFNDVPVAELSFNDSSITALKPVKDSGAAKEVKNTVFNQKARVYTSATTWKYTINFSDKVPASLQGTLLYTYGKGEEFYPSTAFAFSVPLEGGLASTSRILIPSIDINHPVVSCGDDQAKDKSLLGIFMLGFAGGLIALVTPCVFPLIPLTVSFFTKKSGNRKRGLRNALLYGLSIFAIYALLSLPFHLLNTVNPEILNNISTNAWLNVAFFVIFIFFALSFFGLYEINLPSGLAGRIDAKSGLNDIGGIFFMALTLAIVSFSCTGPILGSLLAGTLTGTNGANQLTAGMSGFGLGLALPFALFSLFPHWLQSLPKSGGWLNSVKVVLGFLELAMAVKFLSNADLVKQWHILRRETFITIWILIGIAILLYLLGVIRFSHDSKPKFSSTRFFFIGLFALLTAYLLPGVTNTRWARLSLISGFPPPVSYSVYDHPVNYETSVEPLRNYDQALALAKAQHKPLLIDFTGWACVNCRRMEENVWVDDKVKSLMKNDFVVVSLYVDERKKLPAQEQIEYQTKTGIKKSIISVGDKWATFQSENFNAVSQPQYAIISPQEVALTKTKSYTRSPAEFANWLKCGLDAYNTRK